MTSVDVRHLSDEQQLLATEARSRVSLALGTSTYFTELENYADVMDQVGLHTESRDKYEQVVTRGEDELTVIRCRRKMVTSFVAQRDFPSATRCCEEALSGIKRINLNSQEKIDEYFRINIEAGFVNYFLYEFEKVEDTVRELRSLQSLIKDDNLRIGFMHVVGMSLLIRYRWYKMPEEAFTHAEYFLQLARVCADPVRLSLALCNAGFNYLWNEELTASRKYFMETIALLRDKHYGPLLMAYNYLTLGYRMENNISMTEQWANLTLEKAVQTSNLSYLPYANAHLAWVHAKRNNWLYAENYARQAKENWNTPPLLFSYAFVLIDCLIRKGKYEEAGQYAYMLIHPKVKKMPASITDSLHAAVSSWVKDDRTSTLALLNEAVAESKTTGYY